MFKGKVLLFSLLLLAFATSLYAGDVHPCQTTIGLTAGPMRLSTCPQGDFEFILTAAGGSSDYIWVIVRDSGGVGIPGIPWTDYWFNACDPLQQLCLCAAPITADSLTNSAGRTTFSGRLSCGGCVLTDGLWFSVQGKTIVAQPGCTDRVCLDIVVVSPDITADCDVNLSDFTALGLSYNKNLGDPAYNPCCDFNDDDKCNLSDFTFLGSHYYHHCF
ncbi:MAG: hypothetical protein JXB45_00410 [Candidatus Krumholzibacteriota bacterium]|nr:hypothetical protein [Candidatus Krumholzibacteriota bacterium]